VHEEPDDAVAQLTAHARSTRLRHWPKPASTTIIPRRRLGKAAYHQRQRDFLTAHFEMAVATGLNVVIHTRDRSGDASFQDALAIYRLYADRFAPFFHCFTDRRRAHARSSRSAPRSFGGVTTFKNAGQALDTVLAMNDGEFMLETDSPYLAPMPHRDGATSPPTFATRLSSSPRKECRSLLARADND